jgi:glycosyltransferase involved in cell wall biosynthesis
LKIGLFNPFQIPYSLRNYTDNVVRELVKLGVKIISFSDFNELPRGVDLYWDPRGGRGSPPLFLKNVKKPVVVTFHGVANVVLPLWECFGLKLMSLIAGYRSKRSTVSGWSAFRGRLSSVIAVSKYAKRELETHLGFGGEEVVAIYHGVDHSLFRPGLKSSNDNSYILHVSSYQPKKNLKRITNCYDSLRVVNKPPLIVIAAGYPGVKVKNGIKVFRSPKSHKELVSFYQNAMGFIFPSLHETFGMPILEAMASGCPVITSNITGCAEVAGEAAMLINPRSSREITAAIEQLTVDEELRQILRAKGLKHASNFTWRKCGEEHLRVFERTCGKGL